MTNHFNIKNAYFEWLYDLMCADRFAKDISYRKLFQHLHSKEFIFSLPRDEDRADDGISLRYHFSVDYVNDWDRDEFMEGPCSVLEMMVALAIRCEDDIMDDPAIGDRSGQWFWIMVSNLGLGSMIDNLYDEALADEIIDRFLYREYEPNGRGGLFIIENCEEDLRNVEIQYQLYWYLNNFPK